MYGAFEAPWQQTDAYTGGRGGYDGGGMVSALTHADIMSRLMGDKYDSYVAAANSGAIPMNWYTAQELRGQRDRFANTVANNGYTGQTYARPQFEVDAAMAEYNEAARQWSPTGGAAGQQADLSRYLTPYLMSQQRGQTMHPWTATAIVGSNFGSDPAAAVGGMAKFGYNTAPTDANRPSAFGGGPQQSGWNPGGGSVLGGPGGAIPYGQPYGSTGTGHGYNSFGPGGSFGNGGTTGNKYSDTQMRNAGGGNYSPDTRNRTNPIFDYQPYYEWKGGATAVPYGLPSTVDVRKSPSYTQQLTSDVSNYAGGAAGALRNFNSDLQNSMSNAPISARANQMSRDMGVFGEGAGNRYQPPTREVFGPWNIGGLYDSGNTSLNMGMLDAYFGPHYTYGNPWVGQPGARIAGGR